MLKLRILSLALVFPLGPSALQGNVDELSQYVSASVDSDTNTACPSGWSASIVAYDPDSDDIYDWAARHQNNKSLRYIVCIGPTLLSSLQRYALYRDSNDGIKTGHAFAALELARYGQIGKRFPVPEEFTRPTEEQIGLQFCRALPIIPPALYLQVFQYRTVSEVPVQTLEEHHREFRSLAAFKTPEIPATCRRLEEALIERRELLKDLHTIKKELEHGEQGETCPAGWIPHSCRFVRLCVDPSLEPHLYNLAGFSQEAGCSYTRDMRIVPDSATHHTFYEIGWRDGLAVVDYPMYHKTVKLTASMVSLEPDIEGSVGATPFWRMGLYSTELMVLPPNAFFEYIQGWLDGDAKLHEELNKAKQKPVKPRKQPH